MFGKTVSKTAWFLSLYVFALALLALPPGAAAASGGKVSASAVLYDDDLQITDAADDQSQPDVAYDGENHRYLAVWTDARDGDGELDLYGAIVDPSTGTVSVPDIAISTASGDQSQPVVAFDEDNRDRFLVVWSDARNGYSQIYGQFITAGGALSGSAFTISDYDVSAIDDDYEGYSQESPSVVFNEVTKEFMVAWLDTTNDDKENEFDAGEFLLTYFNIDTGACLSDAPVIEYDPFTADDRMVRYRTVSALGSLGSVVDFSKVEFTFEEQDTSFSYSCEDPDNSSFSVDTFFAVMNDESSPVITYNPVGNPLLLWAGKRATAEFVVTLTETGGSWGWSASTSFQNIDGTQRIYVREKPLNIAYDLDAGAADVDNYYPSAAVDADNTRLLVAFEAQETDKDIKGQLVDIESFSLYGTTIEVSTESEDQSSPEVAYDPVYQKYLVVWEDERNRQTASEMDVYGQFVDAQGSLAGDAIDVSTETGNQASPAIDFEDVASGTDGIRRFMLVWKDSRNLDNADIYGRLVDSSDVDAGTGGLSITTTALPDAQVSAEYSTTLVAEGGTLPYSWEVIDGSYGEGLALNSNSGGIDGTPTAPGNYAFTAKVTDAQGNTDQATFTLYIADAEGTGGGSEDSGGGGACFIATAAYGSYLDPHVAALREFRDNCLESNTVGRAFVRFYYRHSPPVAEFIARHEAARAAVRCALAPVVYTVQYPLPALGLALAAGGAALGFRRRKAISSKL